MKAENKRETYLESWFRQSLFDSVYEYCVDAWQRTILYTDIMCKRGNMYLEHTRKGQPPVLVFDYEMILCGRSLERPVNYAIVKIVDPEGEKSTTPKKSGSAYLPMRPIVVIDPRAGHGPGIGGSKFDSQIGVALRAGHPVYFVMFYTEPEQGQTMADVQRAQVRFLEEVIKRHPGAELPAVIGNCQAGWATALIGADRPDVTGPMIFNGSPLSYWGGVEGANPLRYKGGLLGGVWMTSLFCDLGNGKFDGANLVYNFEELNPANTVWAKQYNLYANVDTEEERYLNFEKWWGGFFKMNREEIHFIVDSLFVGNELEQGRLQLEEDRWVNLKHFKDPIVVFASQGDNITPPQQALNWIYKVYKTVNEIRRNGQVIVYIVHPEIGHLGIFVGSKVARKEHSSIIDIVDMIEYLSPGLYEMVITDPDPKKGVEGKVEFVERDMEDILRLDDGLDDEVPFTAVSAISRLNDKMYLSYVSPMVRAMINEGAAEAIRQLHPLRTQRYLFSDQNPFLWPFKFMAPVVKEHRQVVDQENAFVKMEKQFSEMIIASLDAYRDYRDTAMETVFKLMYENSWIKTLFPEDTRQDDTFIEERDPRKEKIEKELWLETMTQGGAEAAAIRIVLAVSAANKRIDQRQYMVALRIIENNDRLKKLDPSTLKHLVKEQAAIVAYNRKQAISTLIKLLPKKADRQEAFEIANSIATANLHVDEQEQELLDSIKKVLKL